MNLHHSATIFFYSSLRKSTEEHERMRSGINTACIEQTGMLELAHQKCDPWSLLYLESERRRACPVQYPVAATCVASFLCHCRSTRVPVAHGFPQSCQAPTTHGGMQACRRLCAAASQVSLLWLCQDSSQGLRPLHATSCTHSQKRGCPVPISDELKMRSQLKTNHQGCILYQEVREQVESTHHPTATVEHTKQHRTIAEGIQVAPAWSLLHMQG